MAVGKTGAIKWGHSDRNNELVGNVGCSSTGSIRYQEKAIYPFSLLVSWVVGSFGFVSCSIDKALTKKGSFSLFSLAKTLGWLIKVIY